MFNTWEKLSALYLAGIFTEISTTAQTWEKYWYLILDYEKRSFTQCDQQENTKRFLKFADFENLHKDSAGFLKATRLLRRWT